MSEPSESTTIDKGPKSLIRRAGWLPHSDTVFRNVTLVFGFTVVVIIAWIGLGLFLQSRVTQNLFGWKLLVTSTWDVPREIYGALPYIYGTLVSSAIALCLAVPIGIGAALFLTEVAPRWIAGPVGFLIELLAAIPSVIFGLWGFLVLCPWMQAHVNPWLADHLGSFAVFTGPPFMTNMLTAGVILAIMVLPFITSISRDVIKTVPDSQREAALGLGATKWEMIKDVVLQNARSGIVGAVMLAFGRAVGETMAVVMVIGNTPQIKASVLQPAYSMPALLANQFNEAYNDKIQLSALIEVALILFVVTLIVNAAARGLLLWMGVNVRATRRKSHPTMERLGKTVAPAVRIMGAFLLAAIILFQLVADFKARGPAGLVGPVEIILLGFAAIRGVTALLRGKSTWVRWRKANNAVMHGVISICALLGCGILAFLFVYVSVRGMRAMSLNTFTQLPYPPGEPGGGMKNAVVGTLMLVAIASAIGIPIGLMGGIYLSEFSKGRAGGVVRFAADVLNGIPSVVIGMFAYAVFVLPFGGFSAWAGGAALGIMMIPTVMRTTDEMLRLVPDSLREASLGLGATHVRTIRSVVLPAARGGIMTGIMLAVARIAGETAPLLFTAFGNDALTFKPSEPVSSLTMKIYQYAISAYSDWIDQAWAGALALLLLVFVISLLARIATRTRYAMR